MTIEKQIKKIDFLVKNGRDENFMTNSEAIINGLIKVKRAFFGRVGEKSFGVTKQRHAENYFTREEAYGRLVDKGLARNIYEAKEFLEDMKSGSLGFLKYNSYLRIEDAMDVKGRKGYKITYNDVTPISF